MIRLFLGANVNGWRLWGLWILKRPGGKQWFFGISISTQQEVSNG